MMQMERNPLSIQHVVVVAKFRELGMSRRLTKKCESTLRFYILWNLTENILKFSRNLSCEILLYMYLSKQELIFVLFEGYQIYRISS
jgi:hypothetical protein